MTRRIRPSLRKLEKAERAATGNVYEAHRAAMHRIEARLSAALDRIVVAAEFREFSGGTVAQLQHARRFLQDGQDEPETLLTLTVADETADDLMRILANLWHDAVVVELELRAARRDGDRMLVAIEAGTPQ